MMFTSIWLIRESAEYSVVVFPEPVGPVTSTMPYGLRMALRRFSSDLGSKPNVFRSSVRLPLSRIRSTIFSPNSTGNVETRKSITREPILSLMRPSCGTRRSAMLSCAMIFTRDVSAARIFTGGFITSCSAPSTR